MGGSVVAGGADAFVTASETIAHHVERATGLVRTCNAGLPREVALAIPFDERFPAAAAEDRDWCARLVAAGVRIVREPRARVRHLADPGAVAFGRQHLRYGRAAARHGRTAAGGGCPTASWCRPASGKDSSPVDSFSRRRRRRRRPGMRSRRCGRSRRLGWAGDPASESKASSRRRGPAGLTAAFVLRASRRAGRRVRGGRTVGGIAKTVEHEGFRFDLGGHRFFTKLASVERLWEDDARRRFPPRPRLSRIYYRGHFFAYPLRAEDVVRRLGVVETVRCRCSYLVAAAPRRRRGDVRGAGSTSRFGRRLYDAFFRSTPRRCGAIRVARSESEWAAQRIRTSRSGRRLSVLGSSAST